MRKKVLKFQFTSWILLLTASAGFLNAITLIQFATPSSHHTGNLTNSMIRLIDGDLSGFLQIIMLLFAYLIGTVISGFLFPDQQFKLKRRYGWIEIIISLLIVVGSIYIKDSNWYLLETTMILGLQNGMFVYYKGIIVRTTHMTGNLTDTGLAIGRALAGHHSELWKARFQLINLSCFLLGGLLSTTILFYTNLNIWQAASSIYMFTGLLYFLLYHHFNFLILKNNEVDAEERNLLDYIE